MGEERRIHPRTDSRLEATLRCGDEVVEGVVENVGAGGVFFATENLEVAVDDGSACVIAFTTPAGTEFEQPGTVLRGERYFDGSRVIRAFAVKFDGQVEVASLGLGA
jgi:hypothetical protein